MKNLRFRQVHLDFHTSPHIPGIGEKFNAGEWRRRLTAAGVNSVTCFSVCHHGYSYHPTEVGEMHPHLKFDLLRAQIDACHASDINVPVYITAGFNDRISYLHPEWNEVSPEGVGRKPFQGGFHKLCFNTPYLDLLCDEIREAVRRYPDCDGIFLDIIYQGECCCGRCVRGMLDAGLNPEDSADRRKFAAGVLENYYRRTYAAVRDLSTDMPVFHNSGNVAVGKTGILRYFSHLELESLPTGGWGYDHYPFSAAYSRNLGMEFLGMTGKFHTTWGEFGGFKHPNALRYECSAMIANGSKCSVGDQLHPDGELDESTYEIIGQAYREVAGKEPWCDNVRSLAGVAILSAAAVSGVTSGNTNDSDVGASRLLLEGHIPFDVVDCDMDFSRYRCLLLPDICRLTRELAAKLNSFTSAGGKLILSGVSGFDMDGEKFLLEGASFEDFGEQREYPGFVRANQEPAPCFVKTPFVMYRRARLIRPAAGAESLGDQYDPYFQRGYDRYCSHQHTPYKPEPNGYAAGAVNGNMLYFAHAVFDNYRCSGAVYLQEFVLGAVKKFLNADLPVEVRMPSSGRVTLMEQPAENRAVLHLLYANTISRGGAAIQDQEKLWKISWPIEVVEELVSCGEVPVRIRLQHPVKSVRLVPSGEVLPYQTGEDGSVSFTVPPFTCHAMVELAYGEFA